jgi:hypothetical protein
MIAVFTRALLIVSRIKMESSLAVVILTLEVVVAGIYWLWPSSLRLPLPGLAPFADEGSLLLLFLQTNHNEQLLQFRELTLRVSCAFLMLLLLQLGCSLQLTVLRLGHFLHLDEKINHRLIRLRIGVLRFSLLLSNDLFLSTFLLRLPLLALLIPSFLLGLNTRGWNKTSRLLSCF